MANVLRINAPMVFFYDTNSIQQEVERIRVGYPTKFFELKISEFSIENIYKPQWVHSLHIPSQELGKVWLEKIFMLERSEKLNPFHTEWFVWMDCGNAYYRTLKMPALQWPNPNILDKMPKNKILHTTSDELDANTHTFAGTAFGMHKSIVSTVFRQTVIDCSTVSKVGNHIMEGFECGSDQYIFSIMKEKNPSGFHQIGPKDKNGYGTLIPLLEFSKFDRIPSTTMSLTSLTNPNIFLSKYAVITMVSSDDYVKGANTLYYSLVAHWDTSLLKETSFVALVVDSHRNDYIYSQLQGWSIVPVPLITPPYDGAVTFYRFKEQFTKLHVWNMTAFGRVLYLDSDTLCLRDPTLILKNSNHSFGAVLDWERGAIRDHFNMGVFSIEPRNEEFKRLDALRVSERGYRMDMAEQGLLNCVYQNHSMIDLYPFTYNGNLAAAVQNRTFWETNYPRLRFLHYTLIKPFHPSTRSQCDNNNESCLKTMKLWDDWFACVPE